MAARITLRRPGGAGAGRRGRAAARPVLLAIGVFAATTLLGACLAAASEGRPDLAGARPVAVESPAAEATAPRPARAEIDGADRNRTVAHLLIYFGATALMISTVGMVLVARGRRRW